MWATGGTWPLGLYVKRGSSYIKAKLACFTERKWMMLEENVCCQ
jgi:hypothetical protein